MIFFVYPHIIFNQKSSIRKQSPGEVSFRLVSVKCQVSNMTVFFFQIEKTRKYENAITVFVYFGSVFLF